MVTKIIDLSAEFNANNGIQIECQGWNDLSIQFVSPTGTIALTASNDDGSVTGSVSGSALTATNFQTVQATKMADGTAVTSVAAAGLYKIPITFGFFKAGGASAAATKVLVYLGKTY